MLVRKLLKIQTLLLIPVLYFIWWLNFDLDRRVRALTNEALRDAKLNIANPAALIKKSKEESAYENPEDEEEYVINENDDEDEEEKEDLQPAQVKKQNYSIETEFRWHMEQDRRKETLRRACKNIPFTPLKDLTEKFSRNLFFLAVDDRHEAMYCFIPKVIMINTQRLE
ncbi:hypothetical protein SK128_026568 [Halocaridina rubra]|uniref:Uncharacterized protein n=1 Tax=Halocaridina rubra TaxID=373956 RepID=A0AAN8WX90_HALRR